MIRSPDIENKKLTDKQTEKVSPRARYISSSTMKKYEWPCFCGEHGVHQQSSREIRVPHHIASHKQAILRSMCLESMVGNLVRINGGEKVPTRPIG